MPSALRCPARSQDHNHSGDRHSLPQPSSLHCTDFRFMLRWTEAQGFTSQATWLLHADSELAVWALHPHMAHACLPRKHMQRGKGGATCSFAAHLPARLKQSEHGKGKAPECVCWMKSEHTHSQASGTSFLHSMQTARWATPPRLPSSRASIALLPGSEEHIFWIESLGSSGETGLGRTVLSKKHWLEAPTAGPFSTSARRRALNERLKTSYTIKRNYEINHHVAGDYTFGENWEFKLKSLSDHLLLISLFPEGNCSHKFRFTL